jgi:adenosylcobinamide-phosphate synthase
VAYFNFMPVLTVFISLLIDRLLGEPKRFHPLVGFGALALKVENQLLRENSDDTNKQRLSGIIACLILIVPPVALLLFILYTVGDAFYLGWMLNIIILYLVIGAFSLEDHAFKVKASLEERNIDQARENVSRIVSRNTEQLDEEGICKATIESVLENGSDAIFAPIFWFMIAGAPGAVCYRLINTLDAMWGYRNERYKYFGWAVARLDDIVNWIPARLTALSYALVGNFQQAIKAWREQGQLLESPNAGPVMCSGAGALNLSLGGPAVYHGRLKEKPVFGEGSAPGYSDINRAIDLIRRSIFLWLIVVLLVGTLI